MTLFLAEVIPSPPKILTYRGVFPQLSYSGISAISEESINWHPQHPMVIVGFFISCFCFCFLCAFFPCLARVGLAAFSLVPDPQQYTSSLLYSTPTSVRQRLFPKQLHQISKNRFFITHIHTRAYLSNILLPTSARRHPHCTGIQIPVKKVYKYKDPTLARWKWLQFVICPLRFNYSLL